MRQHISGYKIAADGEKWDDMKEFKHYCESFMNVEELSKKVCFLAHGDNLKLGRKEDKKQRKYSNPRK